MKAFQKKVQTFKNELFNVEVFDSANEVAEISKRRRITDSRFHDFDHGYMPDGDWAGVSTFDEALELLRTGYQPTVDKLKTGIKANLSGQGKRISFFNDVTGFAPVVPLALQGVPNCMMNSYMKPIKAKVLNVYYDMTAHCGISCGEIMKAGQTLLAAIMELEMQGYKFNLYATQNYWDRGSGCDMLCTKIKSSNTPLDLKRISFPLTHTAYLRVIGFDWYSKTPKGKFRYGYGHPMARDFSNEDLQKGFGELFGQNCVVFSASKIIGEKTEHIKKVICDRKEVAK